MKKQKLEVGELGELVEKKTTSEKEPGGLDLPDGHHCLSGKLRYGGHTSGFTKRGNEFELAPGMKDTWREIDAEQRGLNAYIASQNDFILKSQQRISRMLSNFWEDLNITIGIPNSLTDTHEVRMVEFGTVRITPKPPKEPGA